MNILFDIISDLREFCYTRHCLTCGEYIGRNIGKSEFVCDYCFNSIPMAPDPGQILYDLRERFEPNEFAISSAISLFASSEESPFIKAIYNLKYSGFYRIGEEFGVNLGKLMLKNNFTNYDAIIPAPIHSARRRERGYNQAWHIAKGVVKVIGGEANEKIIKKAKYTISQTKLNSQERRKNVAKAFAPYKSGLDVTGAKFVIVDDVLTTGSTLNACANLLLVMGAAKVDVATLLKA